MSTGFCRLHGTVLSVFVEIQKDSLTIRFPVNGPEQYVFSKCFFKILFPGNHPETPGNTRHTVSIRLFIFRLF